MPRAWWLLAVPAIVVATWPRLASVRVYDPDEFEHLHAAWCVAHDQVPYRDFFEHHGPLTYYLLAPVVRWAGDSPGLLTAHRALSLAWVAVAAAGMFAWSRRRPRVGFAVAAAWLFTFPWFLEKGVEGRPDVPAMALLTWAAVFLRWGSNSSKWWWVGAGAALGTASLFTQKVAFVAAGTTIGCAIFPREKGRGRGRLLVLLTAGFALPWFAAMTWFQFQDALGPLLSRTLATPATWPPHVRNADESVIHRLSNAVSWAPGHLAALAAAAAIGLMRLCRGASRRRGEGILWCGLVAHLAGAPFVPAYLQYYLLVAPIAALLIGEETVVILRRYPALLVGCAVVAFGLAAVPRLREFTVGIQSLVPTTSAPSINPYAVVDLATMVVIAVAVFGFAVALFRRTRRETKWATFIIAAALMGPGVGRYVIYHCYWQGAERQRQDLAAFGEVSPGPVLDGFSGLGCLRPHVGYWWWINHHSMPLIRKEGRMPEVLEAVRARTPAVIVYDEDLRRVPGLEPLLLQSYDPTPFRGRVLFVRRAD